MEASFQGMKRVRIRLAALHGRATPGAADDRRKLHDDRLADVALCRQRIAPRLVDGQHRMHGGLGRGVDQMRGHADAHAAALDGPLEHQSRAERTTHVAGALSGQRRRRGVRCQTHGGHRAQRGTEIVCQAIAKVLDLGIAVTDDDERQHRNRCHWRIARVRDVGRNHDGTDGVEFRLDRACGLVAVVRLLGQQPVDDALEGQGLLRRQAAHRDVRLVLNRRDQRAPRLDVERARSGRHLIQHGAKRKEVAPVVDRRTVHQTLRRHVVDGPEDDADVGQIVGGLSVPVDRREMLGETEIEQLDQPVVGQEDVAGRDVTVDDALLVGNRQRIGDLATDHQHLIEWERRIGETRPERAAAQQLHRDERHAGSFINVEHRADIGVIER